MSGPKISVYSLTGHAREIVIGQINCEQESMLCALEIESILKQCENFSSSTERLRKNIQLLIRRTSQGEEQLAELQKIEETIQHEAIRIKAKLSVQQPSISDKYQISEEAYAQKKEQMKKLQALRQEAGKLKTSIDRIISRDKKNLSSIKSSIFDDMDISETQSEEHKNYDHALEANQRSIDNIQKSILSDLSGIYSFEIDDTESEKENEFLEKKKIIVDNLRALLSDSTLPQHLISEIQNTILSVERTIDIKQLSAIESITIKGIHRKIHNYQLMQIELQKTLLELKKKYQVLCEMSETECQQSILSSESVEIINEEIKRIEDIMKKQREQAYISDCIDEVMIEMGYSVLGSREVTKRNGKHFRNELYNYGDGTAVNVTYSPDGRIAMELGGLDTTDRIPTDAESTVLCGEMEDFCDSFKEIEKRLLAKGVVLASRVQLLPPDAAYASIINTSDYDMKSQTKRFSAQTHRGKAAEKKTMKTE